MCKREGGREGETFSYSFTQNKMFKQWTLKALLIVVISATKDPFTIKSKCRFSNP